jgi:hypothetical protein
MVQLFRKIRQKLLAEKKITHYFTYAIGEILLVVIGILLALQFNNWSIEKNNSVKERWYLINMVEDIEYQRGTLEFQKKHYQKTIETAKSILRDYKKTKKISDIDSLNEKMNLFIEVSIFPNVNNTYQELVSSGQQAIIKNKDLSISIIDYYLFCEDNYKDVKNNNDNVYYRELHPIFYNYSQITVLKDNDILEDEEGLFDIDDEIAQFLRTKLEDQEMKIKFLNALKALIILNTIHLDLVIETIELGIELVKEIDVYLGFTPEMVNKFKTPK